MEYIHYCSDLSVFKYFSKGHLHPDESSNVILFIYLLEGFLLFIYLFIIYLFIYLFMAVLGLRFCARAFSSCGERGPLFIAVRGPLLLRSTGSRCTGSAIVAHGPSCSAACGIFPDQGSNPCPLHWQADSQPLRHQGSPRRCFCTVFILIMRLMCRSLASHTLAL